MKRLLSIIPLLLFALGCGQPPAPKTAAPDPLFEQAQEARSILTAFYLRTFGGMIRSGHYDRELPVARLDHFAHRLWIPDRDWTYDEAIKQLSAVVQNGELDIKDGEQVRGTVAAAFFRDDAQLHRDQYAMIASEMGMKDLAGAPLERYLNAAMIGYGTKAFTVREDHPWTVTLLATRLSPDQAWRNANGKSLKVKDVVGAMVVAPFFPADRHDLACFDYHTVYALAAAVRAGHTEFADHAGSLMRQAFDRGESVCARYFAEDSNSMDAVVGRIKLNGHMIEAYYRGGEMVFDPKLFRANIERAVEQLLEDSKRLRDVEVYEGPPDVFIAVPHAIHGLDLMLRAR